MESQDVVLSNQPWPTGTIRAFTTPAITLQTTTPPLPYIMAPQGYRWSIITWRAVYTATATVGTRAANMRVRDMSQPLFSATGTPGTNIAGTVYGESAEIAPVASAVGLISGFPTSTAAVSTGVDVPANIAITNYNNSFAATLILQDQLGLCIVDRSSIDTTDTVRWAVIVAEQELRRGGVR